MPRYLPRGHWIRSVQQLSGEQFFSHGCHYIDLLRWFLGRPVKGIHVGTRLGTPWVEKEGTSDAVIVFESGARGDHGFTGPPPAVVCLEPARRTLKIQRLFCRLNLNLNISQVN